MSIERMRELNDSVLISLWHCSFNEKEAEYCSMVLRERGYKFEKFNWEKC